MPKKPAKVHKPSPTQPRRRGRPRKNVTSQSRSPPRSDSVAEFITVAGDAVHPSPGTMQVCEVQRRPDNTDVGIGTRQEDHDRRRSESRGAQHSGQGASPIAISERSVDVQSQTGPPREHSQQFLIDDAPLEWLDSDQIWNDQFTFEDIGFGGTPLGLDIMESDRLDGHPEDANDRDIGCGESRDTTTKTYSRPPGHGSAVMDAHEEGSSNARPKPVQVRERIDMGGNSVSHSKTAANSVPGQPQLAAVLAIWQRTIKDFSDRRTSGETYELQVSTPVAVVF